MNYYPNMPMYDINNIINKLNEYDNRIKKLEQKISKLEVENKNNYYIEPDNSKYML